MNIVKRIFGALFLLGGIGAFVVAWMLFADGNKNDAIGWAGAGGAAFFFSLVLVATSFGKASPPANAGYPQQFQQPPQGYPQQQPQGYPQQQPQGYPQQQQQQQPPPPYPGPPYPPRT